eukprot:4714515-Amphidinium_carterae.1
MIFVSTVPASSFVDITVSIAVNFSSSLQDAWSQNLDFQGYKTGRALDRYGFASSSLGFVQDVQLLLPLAC